MPNSGLVVSTIQDVTIVNFRQASILDSVAVDTIANELYALVDERAIRKIILDFSPVRFLSSQMLGVLLSLHKKSKAIKGKVVICGLREDLMKVFRIMKIEKLLKFTPNQEKARKFFKVLGG